MLPNYSFPTTELCDPSAGGVFGRVADAKSAILDSKKLSPSKNWVDDFVFFRFPLSITSGSPIFPYFLSDIYDLAKQLGWPWKISKTRPFATEFKYLGFTWDLSAKTVQIPASKKLRYLAKIQPWSTTQKFSKKRWSRFSVPSCIVHSPSQMVGHTCPPSLASRHPSIFHHHPSLKKSPSSAVLSDIQWWRAQLSADFTGSSLARPPPTSTVEFWVDASSSWGIGVVFGNEWDAWQLSPG